MNQHCHATGSADFTYSSGLLWQILPRTGVNLFLQVWLSGFVGKFNLGKRISLEAQGLFRICRNPAVADE
jgi:hypothetical protein